MKKSLKVLLATLTLTTMMATSAYAAEWITNPNDFPKDKYGHTGYINDNWLEAERKAQYDKWASQYLEELNALPTQMDKVNRITSIIRDRFSYDYKYDSAFDYYCIRDGKATCGNYATAVMAFCHNVGIDCGITSGMCDGNVHAWNVAHIDGVWYWVDATESLDGTAPVLIGKNLPEYYTSVYNRNVDVLVSAEPTQFRRSYDKGGNMLEEADGGVYKGTFKKPVIPAGMTWIELLDGSTYFIPEELNRRECEGEISFYEFEAEVDTWIAEHPECYVGKNIW